MQAAVARRVRIRPMRCWPYPPFLLLLAAGASLLPACGSSLPSAPSTPSPVATSFKAFPSSVPRGDTVLLLPTFAGASATVDPGGLVARSGAALRVGPITADTTYTLTVAGDAGSASQAAVTVGPDKRTSRISLGYYTGDQGSYGAIQSFASYINVASADVYTVGADGSINGSDTLGAVAYDSGQGIHSYACVSNYGTTDFDAALAHAAMVTNRTATIASALRLMQGGGFDGVNIDFENLAYSGSISDDRAAYSSFVHELAAQLHASGFRLVLSVPGKTEDSADDTWSYPYDLAALGQDADSLQLMTYDEHGPGWSGPGPVSGFDWVTSCVSYARSLVDPSKLLIGLPAYGYDWDVTAGTGTDFSWTGVPALLVRPGATSHWDAISQSPSVTYRDSSGHSHEAWFENARSIEAKTGLVTQHRLAGLSMWALGKEDLSFWQAAIKGME
jgi:spore germination protein YaaH